MVSLFPSGVRNVLVVAGRLLDPESTAAMLCELHSRETVRIHLLAIEPRATSYAGSFLDGIDRESVHESAARARLEPLCAALDAAGTPYRTHVVTGPWLDTIAQYAHELGCASVVVGDNPHRLLNRLVLRHDRWRIQSFLRVHPQ
jgi:nucleotide-binding universal stress UspA family protein